VDPIEQKLYFALQGPDGGGSIRRVNYDGTQPETLFDEDDFDDLVPTELAVDPFNRFIYWYSANDDFPMIQGTSYDGTVRYDNIALMGNVEGLAVYSVPEPSAGAVALLTLVGLAVFFRRRTHPEP
jgi:hypothetical protein